MTQDALRSEHYTESSSSIGNPESLPFPFNQRTYCHYEPIEKRIDEARVLIVDDLLRDEHDISEVARTDWGLSAATQLKREREIARMALENILSNVERLVKKPATMIAHVSEIATRFPRPDDGKHLHQ